MILTANIEQGKNGYYVAQINEMPAAISQGKTVAKLNVNLLDALNLLLGESIMPYSIEFKY